MMRRKNYCITTIGVTKEEIWKEIRSVKGPVPLDGYQPHIDLMMDDIAEYNNYLTSYGVGTPFKKWLLWKLETGSTIYGNFPENKKFSHVGHCFSPCPYDSDCDEIRVRVLLGLTEADPLPVRVTHIVGTTSYFMETTNRGSKWGYQCTFPGCSFFLSTGTKYFYI